MVRVGSGEGALTPTLERKGKVPAGNHPDLGSVLFYLLLSIYSGLEGLNNIKLHTICMKKIVRTKSGMPPKKLKSQHKRAASIGLYTVTCCDACRGPGTWGTNGRKELMRAQLGLRCKGWGLCVCQRICLSCNSLHPQRMFERMEDGETLGDNDVTK